MSIEESAALLSVAGPLSKCPSIAPNGPMKLVLSLLLRAPYPLELLPNGIHFPLVRILLQQLKPRKVILPFAPLHRSIFASTLPRNVFLPQLKVQSCNALFRKPMAIPLNSPPEEVRNLQWVPPAPIRPIPPLLKSIMARGLRFVPFVRILPRHVVPVPKLLCILLLMTLHIHLTQLLRSLLICPSPYLVTILWAPFEVLAIPFPIIVLLLLQTHPIFRPLAIL